MKIHSVQWTREKVAQFWDFMSQSAAMEDLYFSKMVGDSLIRHVKRAGIRLAGPVLDFGCGLGHLMECLLRSGIPCQGLDFSAESAAAARQRLASFPGFGGAERAATLPTGLPSGSYSTVFLVETIEHLLPADLDATLGEIRRLLAPSGHIIVTTPHDELLAAGEVLCPDCGARFHRIQHVQSWTPARLTSEMARCGFAVVACRPVYFTQRTWASRIKAWGYRLLRYKLPHLLYIGQRTADR